jgi:serine/threonine-protein kinase
MISHPQRIGRYQIVECVGRGGMGVLYRGHDATLERDVAIKLMLVDFSGDDMARERFQREAKAIARLQHRNVVTIHELGEEDNTPFIVMEFLGGRDLEKIMRDKPPLTLDEKLDVVIQLCAGLSFAHERGIVHRDIKPGNVRVLEDGTVKILDFGIAKLAMGGTTQVGTVMGSAHYMAPEQAADEAVDGRADLFSTGVLLYELLSGRKPFLGESPTATLYQIVHSEPPPLRSLVPDVPLELDEVVTRALKKNPDERYNRANEMATDLQIVRSLLQPTTGALVSPNAETQALPNVASTPLDRARPSQTGGRLGGATIRRPPSGPAIDPLIEKSSPPTGATPAPVPVSQRTMIAAGAAIALVLILAVALSMRKGAGDDRAAVTSVTTTAPPATSTAAPPPVAAAVPLTIESVPSGARILLDGKDTGRVTPAAFTFEGTAPKQLQLQLKGYQPLVARLDKTDLAAGTKTFALTKDAAPVRVAVSGSFPFQVLQGPRVISPSKESHEIVVQPGQTGFRVSNADVFLNQNIDDELRRGRAINLPDLATVTVFASPDHGCTISIDGRNMGDPPVQNQSIAAGVHTFSARWEDGRGDSQRMTIVAGELKRVRLSPKE